MLYNLFVPEIYHKNAKIAIGLSGGVDSAVGAYLLKKQGYQVTGVYMQCWDAREDGCTSEEDKASAIKNASFLDIPFKALDFRKEYKDKVIEYFYAEYKAGRTPNPDVMCNKEIKFGLFYEWAIKNGFDYIATGHYASTQDGFLLKGKDKSKDQSYFLYRMSKDALAKTIFPIGDLLKTEVRKIAEEAGLPAAKRPESMGICFIGEVDIKKFLEKRLDHKKGKVLDTKGKVIGEHDGAWFYTIGQRHGFKLSGYSETPMYVVSKNVHDNTLVVGVELEAERSEFSVEDLHWLVPEQTLMSALNESNIEVRVRHLGKLYKAKVDLSNQARVTMQEKVFGITPGQSCVFYSKDNVLGGGIII